jgi:tRNA dimethylallyltransferase
MNIGTAKPPESLIKALPHHLIGIIDPDTQFNVGEFVSKADILIKGINGRGALPVLSGGTAFYLKHFAYGLPGTPVGDKNIRDGLKREAEEEGLDFLYRKLCRIDPDYAGKIDSRDHTRIIRALEVYRSSGKKLSSYRLSNRLRSEYRFLFLGIRRSRNELYRRIDSRVDEMFEMGLINEIKDLLRRGYTWNDPGLKGIGYREFSLMCSQCLTLEDIKSLVKRNTRRYAKRQILFFQSLPSVKWFHPEEVSAVREAVNRFCSQDSA